METHAYALVEILIKLERKKREVAKESLKDVLKKGALAFDEFIRNTALVDLPLQGRKFTFYMPDRTCKSRLDRFLLNYKWIETLPNISQRGLRRGLSDHCPIVLEEAVTNWGPKPFKSNAAWLDHHFFKEFVIEKWKSYDDVG